MSLAAAAAILPTLSLVQLDELEETLRQLPMLPDGAMLLRMIIVTREIRREAGRR